MLRTEKHTDIFSKNGTHTKRLLKVRKRTIYERTFLIYLIYFMYL